MTTISPTRVSIYDFLYQDAQPMLSLLADTAQLSLPQTRLALTASLQAIVSALLAYQQRYQGQAVSKKLLTRTAVKELRKYNSMNFVTIDALLYNRHEVADTLFGDSARVVTASDYIAQQIDATTAQAQTLLTTLCVIFLRELAILVDYSQLNNDELDKWFALQPQFLAAERFTDTAINVDTDPLTPPAFDPYWYELTKFKPTNPAPIQDVQQATSHYLKAIGRSPENMQSGSHNDMLVFAPMAAIYLPHQRWLLQLAKISDIYLSRARLRITSEPINPPTRPLVNLGAIGNKSDNAPKTASETTIKQDKTYPIWKNPIILIIIVVIGTLSALATLKYQTKNSSGTLPAIEAVIEQELAEKRAQQQAATDKTDKVDSTTVIDAAEE